MNFRKAAFQIFLALTILLSACSNILEPLAKKDSDEALYVDAIKLMDDLNYDEAIAKFDQMGSEFASRPDVLEDFAGALAGKCGLNFINYSTALSTASLSGSTLFKFLMNAWTGLVVDPSSCTKAEEKMKQLWASHDPTASQQLFMAIVSMVKIGTYLRSKADVDGTDALGNGAVDASYNSCVNTDDAHHLTDAEIREVVTGFSLFLQNIADFGSKLSPDLGTAVTTMQAACAASVPNPCETTEVANVTTSMVNSFRDILKTSSMGLEACAMPSPACCPPNPN